MLKAELYYRIFKNLASYRSGRWKKQAMTSLQGMSVILALGIFHFGCIICKNNSKIYFEKGIRQLAKIIGTLGKS